MARFRGRRRSELEQGIPLLYSLFWISPMFDSLRRQRVKPGTIIFREGEIGDCAYVIERGAVEISALRQGESVVLARLGQSDLFGEMALIDDKPRSATARALDAARLIVISRSQVTRKMDAADPLIRLFLRVILRRLRTTTSLIDNTVQNARALVGDATLDDTGVRTLRKQAIELLDQEQRLEEALRRGEFEVFLQPIVSLKSGYPAGFEAVLRWRQPDGNVLEPDAFLGLAEEMGLVERLGKLVLERSCAALSVLPGDGGGNGVPEAPFFVSLNLSARQLAQAGVVEDFVAAIDGAGVDPSRLLVEVTEGALMEDPEVAARVLWRLKSHGLRVGVDDFGTGYSSLSYLQRFPVDVLKVDRSFVTALPTSAGSRKIVRAVTRLAQELDMAVVAEGVEHDDELALVCYFGFGLCQGFLFAPPLPLPEAVATVGRRFFDAPAAPQPERVAP